MGKKVLGKGLDALIPKREIPLTSQKDFARLPLHRIKESRYQPRHNIDEKELNELSQSIKERGIIQPIVVRKINDEEFEIVAGSRRFNAAKSLGLKEIPTIIRELDEKEVLVCAIVENLQRTDLNPIEEALAFKRLMDDFEFSLDDLATFLGKDKTTIANTLRLLKLPDSIKEALEKGILTRTQARTILAIENRRDQEKLFHQILSEGLSVREIEKRAKKASHKKRQADPFVMEVEEKLQKLLGTKVRVFNKRNNRGRILIEYYNLEDLDRILRRLK
ncbi:MAG: ParB/RepB/Spo0J family partition protein [Candidatus Omnitrophota bacterium]|nr:MAG: ParB/RepB/Spo0J family partition protein [Candidatus Omnitrophota bacterium]